MDVNMCAKAADLPLFLGISWFELDIDYWKALPGI